jgi:hypothetical protein
MNRIPSGAPPKPTNEEAPAAANDEGLESIKERSEHSTAKHTSKLVAASDSITVLRAMKPMAKRWLPDGTIEQYGDAKQFEPQLHQVVGIRELSALLSELERDAQKCIIRGRFVGFDEARRREDLANCQAGYVYRRKTTVFEDQALHSILIEVDKFEPLIADPIRDPLGAIAEYIATELPPCFQQASYHWQLSNSFAHPQKPGLRVHLWFWLRTPRTSADLRAWASVAQLNCDKAVFDEIQVHYTAAPRFAPGVRDPVSVRSGFVAGAVDDVDLNLVTAPGAAITFEDRLSAQIDRDPIASHLRDRALIKGNGPGGKLYIDCPNAAEHTSGSSPTSTVYMLPNYDGEPRGNFKCLHDHCRDLKYGEFLRGIGYDETLSEFDALGDNVVASRFQAIPDRELVSRPPIDWQIKGVLPIAELGVVFGESGSGKSFFVQDLLAHIARGVAWRDRKTKQGRAVIIAAEGGAGVRNRVVADAAQHGGELPGIDYIIDTPNLMEARDIDQLVQQIKASGPYAIVAVDTLAASSPGANENSGEDMGRLLANCKRVHRETGATVLLIHHSGKDSSKGARGWSGLRAAVDFEIEVVRQTDGRQARISKLKDGSDGATFAFRLKPCAIGQDEEGEAITSCVVEHLLDAPTIQAPVRKPKGTNQQIVLNALTALIFPGQNIPVADVLRRAAERMTRKEGKRDLRTQHAAQALDGLAAGGFVTIEGDLCTLH